MNSTRKEEVLLRMGIKAEIASVRMCAFKGVCFDRKDLVATHSCRYTHTRAKCSTQHGKYYGKYTPHTHPLLQSADQRAEADTPNSSLKHKIDDFHFSSFAFCRLTTFTPQKRLNMKDESD